MDVRIISSLTVELLNHDAFSTPLSKSWHRRLLERRHGVIVTMPTRANGDSRVWYSLVVPISFPSPNIVYRHCITTPQQTRSFALLTWVKFTERATLPSKLPLYTTTVLTPGTSSLVTKPRLSHWLITVSRDRRIERRKRRRWFPPTVQTRSVRHDMQAITILQYSLYNKKMVQAENNCSTYEICSKSMSIWYHIKVE